MDYSPLSTAKVLIDALDYVCMESMKYGNINTYFIIKICKCIARKTHVVLLWQKGWLYTKAQAIYQLVPCYVMAVIMTKVSPQLRLTSDSLTGFSEPDYRLPGRKAHMTFQRQRYQHVSLNNVSAESVASLNVNIFQTMSKVDSACIRGNGRHWHLFIYGDIRSVGIANYVHFTEGLRRTLWMVFKSFCLQPNLIKSWLFIISIRYHIYLHILYGISFFFFYKNNPFYSPFVHFSPRMLH